MSTSSASKLTFSCARCFERKTRCDKQIPCGPCIKHNVQCISRPRKPSRKTRIARDESIEERLKLYEALLREKGIEPDKITGTPRVLRQSSQAEAPEDGHSPIGSTTSETQNTLFKPQLIQGHGGTKFVDNNLWSRLAEEFHEREDMLEEDSDNESSDGATYNDGFSYVLGPTPRKSPKHPSSEHIHLLWQAFQDNVNPLTKLVHVPSLQLAIEKAIVNMERIPKGFEALMFSMYSLAVLSLTEEECRDALGEYREMLLPRYIGATRTALARANFMGSTSIVTLQALVLHIISIRDIFEPRSVWSLTGVAIRIAENMGMRLDGTLLGLSSFETEIRRRIWWQLNMHDFRAAELSGQAKFRNFELDETTPKMPANVNDSDLHPSMTQAAIDSVKPTEMMYCMLRSELASFAAAQKAKMSKLGKTTTATSEDFSAMNDLKMKDIFIKELEDLIETKYLRFCDPSQPLQFLTLLGARLSTNLIRFIAHHPRRWAKMEQVPASEQQFIWGIAIGLLEQYIMMQSSPQIRRFAWCVPYFIQWHAVIHVLDTLRANPLHHDGTKAWRLIDALYENNPQMLVNNKKPIFMAVGNLCLRASAARSAALESQGRSLPKQPDYINKLQEVRESAKARREAVIARHNECKTLDAERRLMAVTLVATPPQTNPKSAVSVADAPPAYTVAHQTTQLVAGSMYTEDDAFWLSNALNDDILREAGGMMDFDMDAAFAQDYWLENPNSEGIDWEQWDALVSNVDPGRTNFGVGFR